MQRGSLPAIPTMAILQGKALIPDTGGAGPSGSSQGLSRHLPPHGRGAAGLAEPGEDGARFFNSRMILCVSTNSLDIMSGFVWISLHSKLLRTQNNVSASA